MPKHRPTHAHAHAHTHRIIWLSLSAQVLVLWEVNVTIAEYKCRKISLICCGVRDCNHTSPPGGLQHFHLYWLEYTNTLCSIMLSNHRDKLLRWISFYMKDLKFLFRFKWYPCNFLRFRLVSQSLDKHNPLKCIIVQNPVSQKCGSNNPNCKQRITNTAMKLPQHYPVKIIIHKNTFPVLLQSCLFNE